MWTSITEIITSLEAWKNFFRVRDEHGHFDKEQAKASAIQVGLALLFVVVILIVLWWIEVL